ncbi:hypothetical protein EIP86_007233 [Pleurotus ostreatoroseus]|nr:hypothetical protein EIP86_007233 [Pleurotus ostreatoroseus]
MFGPLVVKWYTLLARLQFSTPRKALMYRVYLDQALFAPGIIGFYFTSMTLLEGNPFSKAIERLEKAYTGTLLRNWLVFIPTQLVNFSIVPPHMRVLVVGVVSLFWNTYLSLANARSQGTAAVITDVEKGVESLEGKAKNAVVE